MVRIAAESTGAPPDVARAVLAFFYEPDRGVMPRQAEIDMAGMSAVIALLGRTGSRRRFRPPTASSTFSISRPPGSSDADGGGGPRGRPRTQARFCTQIVPKHAPICA
jgi:hypothetical protein